MDKKQATNLYNKTAEKINKLSGGTAIIKKSSIDKLRVLQPIRLESQIEDIINNYRPVNQINAKIRDCQENLNKIVFINNYPVFNPEIKDDNIYFVTIFKNKIERCYYPIQYASIAITI